MSRQERAISVVINDRHRREAREKLHTVGPTPVYAGLLAYAQRRGWKPGWAAFAFKEIFGVWPRRQDRVEPAMLGDFLIEDWVALRPKRKRLKLEKPAPLFDQVQKPEPINEHGFVSGTLMTADDFSEVWK